MTGTVPDIAHRFTAAFNAGDVDGLLGCFTPDALYTDLFYGRFTGRAGLRRLFERMYAEGEQHEWIMIRVAATPECAIGEWRFSFTVSSAVPRSSGRRLSFRGASVFETRGGLCCAYREYFDRGAALLALGVSPATMARIAAARPSVQVSGPDLAAHR
ncbi:MAG TPA: nuclear transport factor 2 family protein [Streptosporangiaceae bacterium]|jgi:ketosteroid isomerase-like protein|nr:nuclear transport factor 2 family protein [Streptosporangiaceae bacterium]